MYASGLLQRYFGGLFINCSRPSAIGPQCGCSPVATYCRYTEIQPRDSCNMMYFTGYLYGSGLPLSCATLSADVRVALPQSISRNSLILLATSHSANGYAHTPIRRLCVQGASIPKQPWRSSPQFSYLSLCLPPPPPPQTIFWHFLRNFVHFHEWILEAGRQR